MPSKSKKQLELFRLVKAYVDDGPDGFVITWRNTYPTRGYPDTDTIEKVVKISETIKYSDLEQNFDGVTQMYEGLTELEDSLIDYIEVIQTVKGLVKDKLKDGNFKTDDKVKDKLFYEVQDLQTFANQWLPDYSGNVIGGFNKLVGDTDEENFHQL